MNRSTVPKIVDHDARRRELVEIASQVIAKNGVEGATLRELAAEAGFSNGAIKPYFPTKDSLFEATFTHVFSRTNARIERRVRGLRGWDAVLAFAQEVLPLDAAALDEARVVVAYWALAAQSPATGQLMVQQQAQWRQWLTDWVAEALAAGEVRQGVSVSNAAEALLTFFEGAQIVGVIDPVGGSGRSLRGQLDQLIDGWAVWGSGSDKGDAEGESRDGAAG
ncbi:TetR/AcrR family transcriptional regulator [Galactobacter valiniphilus]|uniref:TetR/AcrR family transcriptional regulator n=1 Tax=Galactobacter valiniphilus TaxID=2676122 RepID=A0A399J6Z8_9MICC|nr:TetR/AcrR family transcriptional regulator [Galactobacter valiniphilus]